MAADQLSKLPTDGTKLGQSAADLIAFHGSTPVVQAAAIVSVSTSAALSICGSFGFTSVQANGLITAVNSILTALNAKGIIAS